MFEIYALNVCEMPEDSSLSFYQAPASEKINKAFYFFCLKNGDHHILIDTGFSPSDPEIPGVAGRPTRQELLNAVGVDPAAVEAVILSHLHGDHFFHPEIYSRAIFYLQRSEFQFWNEEIQRFHHLLFPPAAGGKPAADIETLRRLNADRRVRFLDGDCEIYPGIRGIWCGGHSPGSQSLVVQTGRGPVVCCADFIGNYRNLDELIPAGVLTSLVEWLRGIGKIEQMHLPRESIIPGHDPRIMTMFPAVSTGIVRIA
jgi:glyoxylase-like metal-dependent hydrolase (beta-lactamase superfamily II)